MLAAMQKTLPLWLVLSFAAPAAAADIDVDSTSDDAANTTDCTLRDALAAAASDTAVDGCPAGSGADTIRLDPGTYTLTQGQLVVGSEVTILGSGESLTVVDGAGTTRIFQVDAGADLTLARIGLENASVDGSGGAVLVASGASLTVRDSRFEGGYARSEGAGIHVSAGGSATVSGSTFARNQVDRFAGAGISNDGTVDVEACMFLENTSGVYGGAFLSWSGTSTIRDSLFARNRASSLGGALSQGGAGGTVILSNSTFVANVSDRSGGALYKDNSGSMAIDHCTFVDNEARENGGGLQWGGGTRTITASLFARNAAEGSGDDCRGNASGDDNVMETGGCTISGSGNQTGASVLAGALSDNGGPTLTVPVAYGSDALGASGCVDGSGAALAVDQRGFPRPASGCTAGAYELQVPPVLVSTVAEPAGATCPDGGYAIHTGIDLDGDGALAAAEIDSTDYLCAGLDAVQPLVDVIAEPAGASCAAGGQRVDIGYDDDASGALDAAEITSSFYVCNGADGADGQQTLVSTADEPAGASCASGGVRIDVGLDDGSGGGVARNGALEAGEVQDTRYVCNGADGTDGADGMDGADGVDGETGASALVEVIAEPEGERCVAGGTVIRAGLDDGADGETAGDGVLGDGEVDSETVICNGAAGLDGADGMDGAGGGCSATGRRRSGALALLLFAAVGLLFRRRR